MAKERTGNIRTPDDPVCLAPFVGLFHAPARMSPCCEMVLNGYRDLDDMWNSDLLKSLRRSFINQDLTDIPEACHNCLKSTTSHRDYYYLPDRSYYRETFHRFKDTVREDGHMESRPISYLALGSSNKCNYACRICHPGISSTKLKYSSELGLLTGSEALPAKYDRQYESSLENCEGLIQAHSGTLDEVVIHGGDPTQHENLPEVLDALAKHLRPEAKVCFLSNGSFRKCIDGEVIWEKLKRFENLHIVFSMDGTKEINEYTRIGCKHDRLVKLIWEAKAMLPHAYIGLHATLTNMSIMRLAEFLDYIQAEFAEKGVWLSANVVNEPDQYHPSNLPNALKKPILAALHSREYEHWHLNEIKEMAYRAMIKSMSQAKWQQFLREEQQMDRYSKTKLFDVYPEFKAFEVIQ